MHIIVDVIGGLWWMMEKMAGKRVAFCNFLERRKEHQVLGTNRKKVDFTLVEKFCGLEVSLRSISNSKE